MSSTNLSRRAYATTLLLYPAALRRQFGEEMLEVFSEQLRDVSRQRGWLGELDLWMYVAGEAVRTALCSHMQTLSISLISGLAALGLTCVFFCATSLR